MKAAKSGTLDAERERERERESGSRSVSVKHQTTCRSCRQAVKAERQADRPAEGREKGRETEVCGDLTVSGWVHSGQTEM